MKNLTLTHASVLLLGSAVSALSFGNGFSINEQSARSLGQAFSGRASDADEAATVANNPAGMALLKQPEISVGAAYIDGRTDISNTSASVTTPLGTAPVSGTNEGDMVPGIAIPSAYYVHPLNDEWSVGFGVFAPYGLKTDYENTFQGRYLGVTSELEVITAQPTVSYNFKNGLSLGLGVTYNSIDGKLTRNSFAGAGPDIRAQVKGDDTAWGYNLGALYEIDSRTRVGVSYFSAVTYKLEGDTRLNNLPPLLSSARFDASLDLTTPDKLDFGLTHDLTPQLTAHVDIARTNWRELDAIVIHNAGAPASLATDREDLNWEYTWSGSVGLSYRINPQWTVRGGYGYDPSPVKDSTRSVRVPVNDRQQVALGATWSPLPNLSIDLAYLYFREKTAYIDTTQNHGFAYSYAAKYENSAGVYGLQLSWRI